MNWSAGQQRLLGAMGFELLRQVPAGTDGFTRAAPEAAPGSSATALLATTALAADTGAATRAQTFETLQQALRRAAGDRDVSGLIDDIARLRCEPALKRALWPTLRALRRSH